MPGGRFRSGYENPSTNQRMEIAAALDAARTLEGPLEVVSDSTYVVNCFRDRWWEGWMARGWKTSAKKDVANQDLWKPLVATYLADPTRIRFSWVKGHSKDPMNDLVDRLAVEAAATQRGREGEEPPTVLGPADRPGQHGRPGEPGRIGQPGHVGGAAGAAAAIPGYLVAVTGLRPPELGGYGASPIADKVQARLRDVLAAQAVLHPDLVVASGLGLGAEQLGAQAALDAGLPLAAVLAFPGADEVWPPASRQRFADLVAAATHTLTLQARRPASRGQAGAALARRDAWLARNSAEALVVWNGQDAGVGRTLRSLRDHLGEEQVWVVEP